MEVNFNRKTIISFPNNTSLPDIETGIVDNSLFLDEVLFTDRFTIGECHANRFEVDLYDYEQIDKGEKIYVYQLIDDTDEEPIFTGYVDSCVTNRGRFEDTKHVIAYDALYSKGTVDVAKWWEDAFDVVTKVSVKELRDSLCDFVGIDFERVSLPNDNVLISHTQQLNIVSFQAMLTSLLKVNAANANVDRQGVLRFITISDESPIEIDETYAQNTTEFDNYIVPAFETVRIENTTENVSASVGSGANVLHITDNVLLLDKTQEELADIAEAILTVVEGISYRPSQIDMIYSQLNVTVGNRVQIGENIYLVCENNLSGPQLVDQHISSIGANEIEEAPVSFDTTQKDIQDKIGASSLKYYRYKHLRAIVINNDSTRQIIKIRYSTTSDELVIFHGCVIMDVDLIDDSQQGIVEITYEVLGETVRDYHPTETYNFDGRHTMNLLHYWEGVANALDEFIVKLTTQNCKVTIGAFRIEAYMEGMGLIGEAVWDGLIEVDENIITLEQFATTPSQVIPIDEEVDVAVIEKIEIAVDEYIDTANLKTVPESIQEFDESLYINHDGLDNLTWGEVKEEDWQTIYDSYLW